MDKATKIEKGSIELACTHGSGHYPKLGLRFRDGKAFATKQQMVGISKTKEFSTGEISLAPKSKKK